MSGLSRPLLLAVGCLAALCVITAAGNTTVAPNVTTASSPPPTTTTVPQSLVYFQSQEDLCWKIAWQQLKLCWTHLVTGTLLHVFSIFPPCAPPGECTKTSTQAKMNRVGR